MNFLGPAILGIVSAVIILLGWQVRRGVTSILAGYRAERVLDERGLAAWCGNGLVILGVASLAFSCMLVLSPAGAQHLAMAYVVVVGGGALVISVGARRYVKRGE